MLSHHDFVKQHNLYYSSLFYIIISQQEFKNATGSAVLNSIDFVQIERSYKNTSEFLSGKDHNFMERLANKFYIYMYK